MFLHFVIVATPKQIRELMKVDGLTNDEVKSHLQVGVDTLCFCNVNLGGKYYLGCCTVLHFSMVEILLDKYIAFRGHTSELCYAFPELE